MSPLQAVQKKETYTESRTGAWPVWEMSPPPKGHPEVGKWVWRKYEQLRRHRDKQGLVELWAHFHDLYRGRVFRRKNKYSQVVANLFWKVINAMVANLTDNKPRASIMPNGDTPDPIADGWQAAYDQWWEHSQQQKGLQASVSRSERNGYQCDEMRFNSDLEGGMGDIETHRNDTYDVLFWPGHVDIQTQPGMCTMEALELGEIYDLWPDAKGKVKADPEYSEILQEQRQWVRATRSRFLRPEGSATGYVIPGGDDFGGHQGEGSGIQRAMVIRFWVKDYAMQWVDPRTGEKVKKNEVLLEPAMAPVADPMTGQPAVDPQTGQPAMQPVIDPYRPTCYATGHEPADGGADCPGGMVRLSRLSAPHHRHQQGQSGAGGRTEPLHQPGTAPHHDLAVLPVGQVPVHQAVFVLGRYRGVWSFHPGTDRNLSHRDLQEAHPVFLSP